MPIPLPELPEDNTGICLIIPNSPEWRQIYLGALVLLQQWWYWDVSDPELSESVIQRVMECSYLTSKDGVEDCSMDFCLKMIECINDNEAVRQAIASLSTTSNINSSSPENETNLAGELINSPVGCDNDIIYGMTVQLVEFADRLIKDLLEGIKASNLSGDNVGFLIGAIPVVETLPIDELFEMGYKIANDMEVAYLSASTELLKTEIACELFCLAQDNDCILTLEMVRDYFQEKADVTFDYSDPLSFALDFISGVFVSNAVYYGMNILFFQVMAFGGKFLEYYFEDYLRVINSMFNDPNPDWSTECDDCPDTWSHTFDFSEDDGGFVAIDGIGGARGQYNGIAGAWQTTDILVTSPSSYRRGLYIAKSITPDTVITSVEMTFDMTKGSVDGNPSCQSIYQFLDSSLVTSEITLFSDATSGNGQTKTLTLNETADEIRLLLTTSNQGTPSYSGSGQVLSCKIEGSGTSPFI